MWQPALLATLTAMSERIDVDPAIMQAAADALAASAQTLHTGLTELDAEVVEMLGSWQGAAGHAYAQGWQQWRIGAQHVQSVLAGISEWVSSAADAFEARDRASAQQLRSVDHG